MRRGQRGQHAGSGTPRTSPDPSSPPAPRSGRRDAPSGPGATRSPQPGPVSPRQVPGQPRLRPPPGSCLSLGWEETGRQIPRDGDGRRGHFSVGKAHGLMFGPEGPSLSRNQLPGRLVSPAPSCCWHWPLAGHQKCPLQPVPKGSFAPRPGWCHSFTRRRDKLGKPQCIKGKNVFCGSHMGSRNPTALPSYSNPVPPLAGNAGTAPAAPGVPLRLHPAAVSLDVNPSSGTQSPQMLTSIVTRGSILHVFTEANPH